MKEPEPDLHKRTSCSHLYPDSYTCNGRRKGAMIVSIRPATLTKTQIAKTLEDLIVAIFVTVEAKEQGQYLNNKT